MAPSNRRHRAVVAGMVILLTACIDLLSRAGMYAQTEPRAVLFADDFEDPARGVMPQGTDTETSPYGYVNGEYFVRRLMGGGTVWVFPTGEYGDANLQVDARVHSGPATTSIIVGCRVASTSAGASGYFLRLTPASRLVQLQRLEPGKFIDLAEPRTLSVVETPPSPNHLSSRR